MIKVSTKQAILIGVLLIVFIASASTIDKNNKKGEDSNKSEVYASIFGLIISLLGLSSLGFYILSGGKEAMRKANLRYN